MDTESRYTQKKRGDIKVRCLLYLRSKTFKGEWSENEYHGKGTLYYADGSFYQGEKIWFI
jgi:MORN repeat.